jgi:hypothetical protein
VEATDQELQEWAKHARYKYDGEVAAIHESELRDTKEWLYFEKHPPPPPPPKLEIQLPPEWFAEDDEGAPAKYIEETILLLVPRWGTSTGMVRFFMSGSAA